MVLKYCKEHFPGVFYFPPHKNDSFTHLFISNLYPFPYPSHLLTVYADVLLPRFRKMEAVKWIFLFSYPQSTTFPYFKGCIFLMPHIPLSLVIPKINSANILFLFCNVNFWLPSGSFHLTMFSVSQCPITSAFALVSPVVSVVCGH